MTSHLLRRAAALSLIAVGLLLAAAGCSRKVEAKNQDPNASVVPVRLGQVVARPVQRQVEVVGRLWADQDVTVSAKVAGRITAIYKDLGDTVLSGKALVQIEPVDYDLAVKQKQLALSVALSKLGLTAMPVGEYDPVQVPTVQRAKLQWDNAVSRFKRGEVLFKNPTPRISEQDFEDLKTAADVAKSAYDVELLTARALMEDARAKVADLAMAQLQLQDATIKAPEADVVTPALEQGPGAATVPATGSLHPRPRTFGVAARYVSSGEYVKQGAPVMRLVDSDVVKLRAPVPERFASVIQVGQPVKAYVEAYNDVFAGRITRINPQMEATNLTFEIEAVFQNPEHKLKSGAFVRGMVQTHEDAGVIFVPQEAVVTFAGVNKVFTVGPDNKAKEIVVELGEHQEDLVEITKGNLTVKDQIVVAGINKLAAGVKVSISTQGNP